MTLTSSEKSIVLEFAQKHFRTSNPLATNMKLAQKILMAKHWNVERGEIVLQSYLVWLISPQLVTP
jgi:hypothetical protein